jgi:hypothetical protein
MDSIKGLLDGMLRRHHITAQVTTARVIETANETLARMLPAGRADDAVAVFVRDGAILVQCRNASAAQCVASRSNELLDAIKSKLPSARLEQVRTRIGGS